MRAFASLGITCLAISAVLGGGGGGDPEPVNSSSGDGTATALAASSSQRAAAAKAAANSSSNGCQLARPFYWEVGGAAGALAAGSVAGSPGTPQYGPNTVMPLGSASKWLYAAYVAQMRNGVLTAGDVQSLNFTSGYVSMAANCLPTQTVASCLAAGNNGVHTAQADGRFYYGSGHMQAHASSIGLGGLAGTTLTTRTQSLIGKEIALGYNFPEPAAGASASPASYAVFLRKVLKKDLKIGDLLRTGKVCTNPATCPSGTAIGTPTAPTVSWHYSVGHWVEDDPASGDGAFSSGGSYGFYPWIDASRTYYGVVARAAAQGGPASATCGALIRKAWMSGGAQ
jgi:hypothetical protein